MKKTFVLALALALSMSAGCQAEEKSNTNQAINTSGKKLDLLVVIQELSKRTNMTMLFWPLPLVILIFLLDFKKLILALIFGFLFHSVILKIIEKGIRPFFVVLFYFFDIIHLY